eukprot:10302616-Alexandrium_andersonii.AAC.1
MVPASLLPVQVPRPLFVRGGVITGHNQHVTLLEAHNQVSVAIRLAARPPDRGIIVDPIRARRRH